MARELFAQSAMEHAKPPTFLPGVIARTGLCCSLLTTSYQFRPDLPLCFLLFADARFCPSQASEPGVDHPLTGIAQNLRMDTPQWRHGVSCWWTPRAFFVLTPSDL